MSRVTAGRLLAVGFVFAIIGLLFVFNPRMAANHSVSSGFLFVVGMIGFLFVGAELTSAYRTDRQQARPRDPSPLPRPGEDLDATLEAIREAPFRQSVEDREAVRERIGRIAVRVLVRQLGCTPSEAREHLADGTWTDDPEASRFFAAELIDPDDFFENLKASFADESRFEQRARRAVTELIALEERDD
ncbi:MAG: hypothetical protein ACI9YT_001257 [Halobacteriales archaeon]|jgi:hypothetical protein